MRNNSSCCDSHSKISFLRHLSRYRMREATPPTIGKRRISARLRSYLEDQRPQKTVKWREQAKKVLCLLLLLTTSSTWRKTLPSVKRIAESSRRQQRDKSRKYWWSGLANSSKSKTQRSSRILLLLSSNKQRDLRRNDNRVRFSESSSIQLIP